MEPTPQEVMKEKQKFMESIDFLRRYYKLTKNFEAYITSLRNKFDKLFISATEKRKIK